MKIVYNRHDMTYELNIEDRVCVLYGDSGIGKTFLFKEISKNAGLGNKFYYIDFSNYQILEELNKALQKEDVVIVLDNADLYVKNYQELILNSKCTVIIITKSLVRSIPKVRCAYYDIIHNTDSIKMVRRQ